MGRLLAGAAVAAVVALSGGSHAAPLKPSGESGDPAAGAAVFLAAGCGSCHEVSAVGTTGTIGPPLDGLGTSFGGAIEMIRSGSLIMPAFGDELTEEQIRDVAAFVHSVGQGLPVELLPNLDPTRPERIGVVSARVDGKRLHRLRVRAALENVGPGALVLVPAAPDDPGPVVQHIGASDGTARTVESPGALEPADGEWRLRSAATVQLRRAKATKVLREVPVALCLADRLRAPREPGRRLDLPLAPEEPVFLGCAGDPAEAAFEVGVSSGWGLLAGGGAALLDLTGLRAGRYVLVVRADPDGALLEASTADNASSALIRLRWPKGSERAPTVRVLRRCSAAATCGA